jgi:hypothetical protein
MQIDTDGYIVRQTKIQLGDHISLLTKIKGIAQTDRETAR